MPKMIQIRNVPDDTHRVLKARAAEAGMSLSDYLLKGISRVTRRPSLEEVLRRVEARGPLPVSPDPATVIRQAREGAT